MIKFEVNHLTGCILGKNKYVNQAVKPYCCCTMKISTNYAFVYCLCFDQHCDHAHSGWSQPIIAALPQRSDLCAWTLVRLFIVLKQQPCANGSGGGLWTGGCSLHIKISVRLRESHTHHFKRRGEHKPDSQLKPVLPSHHFTPCVTDGGGAWMQKTAAAMRRLCC